ncbi:MAG: AAA family ATPase [Candidatus Moranbacteria bacterium]|nr:AAA family ATPase [Candidatus Moranbacteria bacterium]
MKKNNRLVVSFNGQEGSGKSTIAKMVAEKLKCPRYYMGQMFRDMAKEKGLDLVEFRKICDNNPDFDKSVDDYVIKLSKEQTNFVIESRTAWHFIPDSLKIYLKVEPAVAAQRILRSILSEKSRSNEDSGLDTAENIKKSILKRRKEDSERYFSLYGIHQDYEENYDFIMDTTELTVEEVFLGVMRFIESEK